MAVFWILKVQHKKRIWTWTRKKEKSSNLEHGVRLYHEL